MIFLEPSVETEFLRMQPEAREAALELDAYARQQGRNELVLLSVESPWPGLPWPGWVPAGCLWRSRFDYSRTGREDLLARLRRGRSQPSWDILVDQEGALVCLRRDFEFRRSRVGT